MVFLHLLLKGMKDLCIDPLLVLRRNCQNALIPDLSGLRVFPGNLRGTYKGFVSILLDNPKVMDNPVPYLYINKGFEGLSSEIA